MKITVEIDLLTEDITVTAPYPICDAPIELHDRIKRDLEFHFTQVLKQQNKEN